MNDNASLQELNDITDVLLDPESHPGQLLEAVSQLHALFSSITGLRDDPFDRVGNVETHLGEGKAISPRDAARCVTDFMRTTQFLRGIQAAIVEAQKRFPGQRIEVLYAGCGPFAPLVIPLTTRFTSDEVQFTLLDIHQRSLDAVRQIVDALDAREYVRDLIRCDAVAYQHPADIPVHLVILEVMQRALEKEPQVALTANLAPQMADGGILIPERIAIDACLADPRKEFELHPAEGPPPSRATADRPNRKRVQLGRIIEVTSESVEHVSQASRDGSGARSLPPAVVSVPQLADPKTLSLMLLTSIQTYGPFGLGDYDSGLTCPVVMNDLSPLAEGDRLEFRYILGEKPGFKCRHLDGDDGGLA